jgi:NADH-quinone oxidoreductase subunit E
MTVNTKQDRDFIQTADEAVDMYHAKKEELIPILMKVNQDLGYIPKSVMEHISSRLQIPQSHLYSVATFYHMFFTEQNGRHVIKFCESAPCHVAGGREVFEALQKDLGIAPGDTSDDGKWTLMTTSCLGVCAVGPVMMVDDDIYGNLTPEQIPDILAKYE